ncbi:uncharacterized protein LOC132728810 [Ruditapes philippinarum]|uniref:uncharacterized protein LOC132728810 n=1 Tax=Ruditapes philippinarum TaxID=129788 RepID=UPI00295B059D|nr:uncharacterized protein LOC132728810 [Ruditapes philippinarum]
MHICVYSLLNSHVTTENVSKVIESVLKLVNIFPNKLPSPSTINNWNIERGILVKKQLSSVCEEQNTTLHSDETSKYGSRWGAFATRDNSGNYKLLGLRNMATKSSQDTLDTFKEILTDINIASEDESQGGKKILTNIKNTMSDRAASEMKFNELLENYRKEVLPDIYENYNELNEESREAIDRMNNFFCGLHSLVNMAETCEKTLNEVEILHFDNKIPIQNPTFLKSGQSGTTRLILTACKSFARRGDEKNGCYGNFKTYINSFLKENNMQSVPLQPLRGNRFNILFTNAGHVYFLQNEMKDFLLKTPKSNALLSSVLFDLKEPFFLAGCKALGLISKIITTPLWHVIESKEITMSQMNKRYLTLKTFLQDCSLNLDDFIKGNITLFEDVNVKKDKVYESLVKESEIDGHVETILLVILPALLKLITKQYKDHLPGGIHENLNEREVSSVDKHNKFPERVFSYLDHIDALVRKGCNSIF